MTNTEAALEVILKAVTRASADWAVAKTKDEKTFLEGRISGLDKAIRVLQYLQEN